MSGVERIRVLLVEDDDEDAAIFSRYVGQMSCYAVTLVRADDEEQARSYLASERPDLIFLDLNLGGGPGGLDLLGRLHREGTDVPVSVVTGAGDELEAVEVMESGAYDYLVKEVLTADLLELAIGNAQQKGRLKEKQALLVERLRELSTTDELTSLANGRYLMQKLEEEVKRSACTGRPFSLLMIDLNRFKEVNDRYGHQAGDEVLRRCAVALQERVRGIGLVARYGVMSSACCSGDGSGRGSPGGGTAQKGGGRPSTSCAHHRCRRGLLGPGSATEDLLRRAGEALYRAKGVGGDRVIA
jgi:PleD family two-component response regulator